MDGALHKRNIVVSAVNIRKGGTLTVLRECLGYLASRDDLNVTAIVHSASLVGIEGIRYVEIPWSVKGWCRRLWCEYVTMHGISAALPETDLWFSLHDTTPRVQARRRAVYCHTSFPFMKVRLRDFVMDFKIPLFAKLTKYAYRINVRRNDFLVVQQEWFRRSLSGITGFPEKRIIVAPPRFLAPELSGNTSETPLFLYPSTPDCHKNFELLCEAARLVEQRVGQNRFKVVITVSGEENRYARWMKKRWGSVGSIDFHGFMTKKELASYYAAATCLVFPSRSETWGLPISEFKPTGKPMALADLPYSRETAAGSSRVAYFNTDDVDGLARLLQHLIACDFSDFGPEPAGTCGAPTADSWESLINCLLDD